MERAGTESWAELSRLIPLELRAHVITFAWDRRRLWALDLPVDRLPVARLDWHLDLPWWRLDDRPFALAPREVLGDPQGFAEHYARAMGTDLGCPLYATLWRGRWTIMDGMHRLLKAVVLELPEVEVRKVPLSAFGKIAV